MKNVGTLSACGRVTLKPPPKSYLPEHTVRDIFGPGPRTEVARRLACRILVEETKMQHHVQPRGSAPPRSEQVQEEIQNFLRAIDSYPTRFAKEPRISFQRHLRSFFSTGHEDRNYTSLARRSSPQKSSAA